MSYDKEFYEWARLHPADVSAVGINDLLDEIDRLQSLNRWRKYPDEKPEDTAYVLVKDRFAPTAIGWFDGKRWFDTRSEYIEVEATHWRPLPAIESEGRWQP